ncbi:hypothetical protein E2C01_046140 [Portunus trituberculatus]|uniref:Uncharacterized protein n=1 Tax=Portunus trituberculatus TaxID=210409 RepID=A0A5B7G4A1_PORTR|nr:hypothetical protein [Portunus trituberculatus]
MFSSNDDAEASDCSSFDAPEEPTEKKMPVDKSLANLCVRYLLGVIRCSLTKQTPYLPSSLSPSASSRGRGGLQCKQRQRHGEMTVDIDYDENSHKMTLANLHNSLALVT